MALTGRAALLAAARRASPSALLAPSGLAVLAGRLRAARRWSRVDVALAGAGRARCGWRATGDDRGAGSASRPTVAADRRATPAARRLRGRAARRLAAVGRAPRRSGTALDVPPGERRRVDDRAARRPGAATGPPTGSPSARSGRSGSPPGRASHAVPWRVRVLPPFTSRKHLPVRAGPAARARRARRGARCAGRAPSSTRCASTSTATTSARSTGGPPPARPTSWCAPGGRSATAGALRARHRPHRRPAGSATRRGWTPRSTPRCCSPRSPSRAGDRVDLLAYDRRVRGRGRGRRPRPSCCPRWSRRWRRWSRRWSRPTGARLVARGAAPRPAGARWSCCSPRSTPAPVEEGLLPVLGPLDRAGTQVVLASVGDPRVDELAARPRRRRGGLRRRRRRAGPGRAAAGRRAARAGAASRSSTRPGRRCAPAWPTATSRSRPPAGSERLAHAGASAAERVGRPPAPRRGRRSRRPATARPPSTTT